MNDDADDPLEAELAALRPHDPSPALRQRVAERLADSPSFSRSRWLWGTAFAGVLAAACLVAILVVRRTIPGDVSPPVIVQVPAAAAGSGDDSLPTLQVYQRALSHSPEAVDALLDRHAVRTSQPVSPGGQVYAFPRSDDVLHTLIGEP